MPFFLRKAISAGPFRFNLSKSGVGLSVGVKGLRFGLLGPRGNYIYAGRGGLYYRKSLNRAGQRVRQPPPLQDGAGPPPTPLPPPVYQEPSVEMVEVESGDVLAMKDSRFGEILDDINAKQKQIAFATIFGVGVGAVGLGILYAVGSGVLDLGSQVDLGRQVGVAVLLLALPAWAIGRWVDSYRRRSVLFYDLDQDAAKAYEAMTHAFDEMMACAGKWHIEAKGAIRDLTTWKRNAGADSLVRLKPARLAYAAPKIIASNITPPSVQLGQQTAYFFPDAAFVMDGKHVGAISYDDLSIHAQQSSSIEEGTLPSDAKIIRQTWKYPNKKDGGPDRRFSNNYQIPVCLYDLAQFSSSSGLNELLEFSRTGVVAPFANAIKNLALQMGRQATPKQSQLSARAEQAREPNLQSVELGLQSVQNAHQMLLNMKADFFRRFQQAPNLNDKLVDLRATLFDNFDNYITAVLVIIASADGPINAKEAEVLNLLLGVQRNEIYYNEILKLDSINSASVSDVFEAIIDPAIQLGAIEQGNKYDPTNDPVVKCFQTLGQAVLSADGDVSQSELACLSKFNAIAQSKAAEISRRIQSRTDTGAGDAPQYAPVANQQSTAQPQSGAFVSGNGGYHFEVVGESHYQADLERIVGGRTEDSASYKCVAILTPEPDNPYDPQAVCVSVKGRKVAHLSRDWAAKFKAALAANGYAQAECNALIVGGWDRGGDRGNFGIKLDIALPLDLKPTAPHPN
jgi:Protein of unknown function (DUF4236)